jgi:hypothetical protein
MSDQWAELRDLRQQRVGDVLIRLNLADGAQIEGLLEGVGGMPLDESVIELVVDGERQSFEVADVEDWTVLPDPALDRSDELRGE